MDTNKQLINALRNLPATVDEVDYRKRGFHLEVVLEAEQVRQFAMLMREQRFYLVFVSAVHVDPAIRIIYQFASFEHPCRIVGRAAVSDDGAIPTISDIFQGANWHERETRDMYGVLFSGHPYLVPLLLAEEDVDLKPLLKGEGALKEWDRVRRPDEVPQPEAAPQKGKEGEVA